MLSQFIIYRGLIATFIQAVFSSIFYMSPVVVGYMGALAFGYSSWYTMTPAFALTLDADISTRTPLIYPELYSELKKCRTLSTKTFLLFLIIAVYQAIIIQMIPLLVGVVDYVDLISLTFTACFHHFVDGCHGRVGGALCWSFPSPPPLLFTLSLCSFFPLITVCSFSFSILLSYSLSYFKHVINKTANSNRICIHPELLVVVIIFVIHFVWAGEVYSIYHLSKLSPTPSSKLKEHL